MGSIMSDEAESEGNEQQAGLEVALERGRDEGAEDEDRPAQQPKNRA